MRHALAVLLLPAIAAGFGGFFLPPRASDLEGVWEVTARSFTTPDSSWTETSPQPGLYQFGTSYYGVQEIRRSGRRPLFDEETTEMERLAAFDVFHAHSGTYRVAGSTLYVTPLLAKGPNTMDGGTYPYAFEVTGNRLVVTREAPGGMATRVTTLRRIE